MKPIQYHTIINDKFPGSILNPQDPKWTLVFHQNRKILHEMEVKTRVKDNILTFQECNFIAPYKCYVSHVCLYHGFKQMVTHVFKEYQFMEPYENLLLDSLSFEQCKRKILS